jgi:Outer membrane protein transport protein (OMPP1/FadL/TodX)
LQAALKKSGAIGAKLNLGVTEPQQMMASALYQLTPALAVMGDLGWQNWSAFGQTTLGISAANERSIAVDLNYSDTIHTAIGTQYRIGEKWLWSAGFAYDSSPVVAAGAKLTHPGVGYSAAEGLMLMAEEAVEIRVLSRQGKSIREFARMLEVSRNTVRRYQRGDGLPYYERERRPGKLDHYKAVHC